MRRSIPKEPIREKFVRAEAGQKERRWAGRRRLTKSIAEIRRVFAAERQMCARYWSVPSARRERTMQRCKVISVAK